MLTDTKINKNNSMDKITSMLGKFQTMSVKNQQEFVKFISNLKATINDAEVQSFFSEVQTVFVAESHRSNN